MGQARLHGGLYTHIYDPDGNMIELGHHPLGLEDAPGSPINVPHYAESPRRGKFNVQQHH